MNTEIKFKVLMAWTNVLMPWTVNKNSFLVIDKDSNMNEIEMTSTNLYQFKKLYRIVSRH